MNEQLYRHDEQRLEVVEEGRPWSFDGDGDRFRLVSEGHRIRLAHLFDPVLAVHTSLVGPLPHQITAVYDVMLPRQPLRFLLADDPGAGKTIMTGLLINELIARGDLQRCLTGQQDAGAPNPPTQPRRYHGTVTLNSTRPGADAGRIAEEVIAHLAALVGAKVTVTLEIEAEVPNGVPEQVVRIVTENSQALKFTSHVFEVE